MFSIFKETFTTKGENILTCNSIMQVLPTY